MLAFNRWPTAMVSDLGEIAKQMAQTSWLKGRAVVEVSEGFEGVRLRIWICTSKQIIRIDQDIGF